MARVLVCDDAADLRLLLRIALEQAGHVVTAVAQGSEVLSRLDLDDRVDLLVLDVQMPEMTGWEVLDAVRAHPTAGAVPVLMCTVKFSHADRRRALRSGCDGYVDKPFDLQELVAAVDDVLARPAGERTAWRATRLAGLTTRSVR